MGLSTDYRPDDFANFVGNYSTVESIQKKLDKDDAHVFLITGPSGCGKTTLSRIIARELGALFPDEEPTKSLNYRELDAGDERGIQDIRKLKKNTKLAPIAGAPSRVWLLDEGHSLTKDAQESLLKALEEAKNHVYFIIATTNPEKLKTTLKRRCVHYTLKPVDDGEMLEYLQYIVNERNADVDDEVLEMITESSGGSIGVALSTLSRIIDLEPEDQIDQLQSSEELRTQSIELCRILIKKGKWTSVTKILRGLSQEDPESVRRAVMGYCASILMKEDNPKAYMIMDAFRKPFYDTPKDLLLLAAYESLYSE